MGTVDDEPEELWRIAKFFRSIVENIPDMVFVKDAESLRFVLFNRAGEELLGIPRADLLGKTDFDFFPPNEASFFRAKDKETIERGEMVEIAEERLPTRAHGERLLHTKKIVLANEDGTPQYLLGISEDITARRTAERELEQLRAAVAGAIVHDFRAPLQGILLQLELLAPPDSALAQTALDGIRNDVLRLAKLTNDLLDSTRVAIEDIPLTREDADLTELVPAIVESVKGRFSSSHCVEVRVHGPVPDVSIDAARLEQILHNLIENAVKHTPAHTPIRVEIDGDDHGAYIRVIDKGPGIDPSDVPRLFERFYQARSKRKRQQGSGLGLFITKGLVVAHGGRIDVESQLGSGSMFRVWFPAVT